MKQQFTFNPKTKSLTCGGVDVITFSDNYASGHQSGINLIMHDKRMINGGDVRFEQTPGQWQPTPSLEGRSFDEASGTVTANLHYPNTKEHMRGFNPLVYPDVVLDYHVSVAPYKEGVCIRVTLDQPIPDSLSGKASFIMEMYPGHVMGKNWIMDDQVGVFPTQPNGPTTELPANLDTAGVYEIGDGKANLEKLVGDRTYYSPIAADNIISKPYATGHSFTALPETDLYCFTVESKDALLHLYDGRMNHNNGWFVLSSELPTGKAGEVLTWYLQPRCKEDWVYEPVIQVSQVGYHPSQRKVAVLECDKNHTFKEAAKLYKITATGKQEVKTIQPAPWGDMLRYAYATVDFSDVKEEGLYQLCYGSSASAIMKIAATVFDRGVWQPVLEYFLPVQMCHMLVREKYRTWHGHCHKDDATMAPVNYNHYDGYYQGPDTLCKYAPGDHVPGLNAGGWHDAGDYDLRIESQAGEVYNLALAYESFHVNYDSSTIDQEKHLVEIHRPDGKNDIQQQIEHGLLTVIGGYEALGRLYRGIICRDLRQYVLLGDGSTMTDGIPSEDDRWVFTEDNPGRELETAGQLAAAYRSMLGFNDTLAEKALHIAKELYAITNDKDREVQKVHAAVELFLSTKEDLYKTYILEHSDVICANFGHIGWIVSRALGAIDDAAFTEKIRTCAIAEEKRIMAECSENPYGVPYHPGAWGAGWSVQGFGIRYYYLYKAFPDVFSKEPFFNALNFVLGCHPGKNTASYASGVGAKSATTAYCANRADYSFIPGGVVSGTELISPDFPEYLQSPFIWQQSEYVLGGGSSNYMMLVLAAIDSLQ